MKNKISTTRRLRLLDWVIQSHGEQKRKYTDDPYWFHLMRVAEESDIYVRLGWEIGICHDLLEDTPIRKGELINSLYRFGYEPNEVYWIYNGVIDLTDEYTSEKYPDKNRAERKRLEAIRLGEIEGDYQIIKVIDIFDNLQSIKKHDEKFFTVFRKEILIIMAYMNDVPFNLYHSLLNQLTIKQES